MFRYTDYIVFFCKKNHDFSLLSPFLSVLDGLEPLLCLHVLVPHLGGAQAGPALGKMTQKKKHNILPHFLSELPGPGPHHDVVLPFLHHLPFLLWDGGHLRPGGQEQPTLDLPGLAGPENNRFPPQKNEIMIFFLQKATTFL